MDHLSNIDAAFLHLETPETPMHVASLILVDLPPGYQGDYYEDFKAMLSKRLHLGSLFTRKLAPMPLGLAEPVWIEDDDVDMDYHVRTHTLRKPGSMDQLQRLVARLHSSLLDRSRPLWEIYIIEGLASGQIGVYSKVHHSGIDGKAGAELARVLYDITPAIREVPPPRRRHTRRAQGYQLGMAELLQAAVSNSAKQYRKIFSLLPSAVKAFNVAGRVLLKQAFAGGDRRLNLGLAPRTLFNDSITNQRSYATLSLDFQELKALGKRVGGTVNTIVMTMCSEALREFLRARHALPAESLIAAVPVSLREEGNDALNNQVSAVRVDLATDIADLGERFAAIHRSSEAAKAVVRELKPVLGVDMPITGAPWLVSSLAMLYGRSTLPSELPPVANVLISNVPGPPVPLYVAGARVRQFFPMSIPYHGNGMNITVQSYAGTQLEFGITSCRRVVSQEEAQELVELLRRALEKIRQLPDAQVQADKAEKADKTEPAEAAPGATPASAKAPRKRAAAKKRPAAKTAAKAATKPAAKAPAKKSARLAAKKAAAKTSRKTPRKTAAASAAKTAAEGATPRTEADNN